MARTKTTYDTFNAIAEPKRRELIETLIIQELNVNQLAEALSWKQPTVSKHLSVLKQVGLVTERKEGRFRVYKVNAAQLKPIQDWVIQFEKYWGGSLDNLENYLEDYQNVICVKETDNE